MKRTALIVGVALLSGCATHPITGRQQILAAPSVQAAYAEARFAVSAGVQRVASVLPCAQECGDAESVADFSRRVAEIGAKLEAAVRAESPDSLERIGQFQIEVSDGRGMSTTSSAGGRIMLDAGLARLEPTDTVVAFLIAREMGHVIARHAEEDSGASLAFSVLGSLLLPGFNLIIRYAVTTLASSALKGSWAADQSREADEIAVTLLERTGISAPYVALDLESGVKQKLLPEDDWGERYRESMRRVVEIAVNGASPPSYTASGN
jgi:predicted Zn-dependent protease